MDSKHTSTPWRISESDACVVFGADGEIVCDSYGSQRPREVEEANAAFIVRACNAHEQLVEALRKAEDALANCYNVRDFPGDGTSSQDEALAVVRVALAAAGAA